MADVNPSAQRTDVVDQIDDHATRIGAIENWRSVSPGDVARVKFYKEAILQWLFRGTGTFLHFEQDLRAGGAYLFEQELAGVGLDAPLRNRIRDLRAQIGVSPHLVRRRSADDGLWLLDDFGEGTMECLLGSRVTIGVDGGLQGVETDPPNYGVAVSEDGTQPWTWQLIRLASFQGALNSSARRVVWAVRIPPGEAYPVGGDLNNGARYNARWTRGLERQFSIPPSDGIVGNWYSPYGSAHLEVTGSGAAHERTILDDELGEGLWGFNLSWNFVEFPDGSTSWTWQEEPWNDTSAGSYMYWPQAFGDPYRQVKQPNADEDYRQLNFSNIYAWVSEISPAFETFVWGDWYYGCEAQVAADIWADRGEYLYDNWQPANQDGPWTSLSVNYRMPTMDVIRDLYDEWLPQYADVYEWCLARFQNWIAGNSQRTFRREQLWVPMTPAGSTWRGNVQRLLRDGWCYLRGELEWAQTSAGVFVPIGAGTGDAMVRFRWRNPTDGNPITGPSRYPSAGGDAADLKGLYGIAFGGEHDPAPVSLFFRREGIGDFTGLRCLRDYDDRTGVILDGLGWQVADPDNE